jgi:hypothetical protein
VASINPLLTVQYATLVRLDSDIPSPPIDI